MQRTLLVAVATAVVAAAIAAGATIVLTGDEELAISSPSVPTQTPSVTTAVTTPSATTGPGAASATPGATTGASAAPAPTDDPEGPTPNAQTRSASSVRCSSEPKFCSDKRGNLKVSGGEVDSFSLSDSDTNYSDVPKIDLTAEPRGSDKERAAVGDPVKSIHAEVVVRNDTSKTFVFDKRDIVLEVFRNGRLLDRLATSGDGFEMTPGGKMTGEFDLPITDDGTYTWVAKTWYHAK